MSKEIWVWAEQRQGTLMPVSLELLGKGQDLSGKLGGKVAAVLIGGEVKGLASELLEHGCDKVYIAEDPALSLYQSGLYGNLLARYIEESKPEIVLWGATSVGGELAAWVAAKLRTGLTAHCIDLYIDEIEGKLQLVQVVPGWGGNLGLKIVCDTRPQMATVKPGVMAEPPRRKAEGEIVALATEIKGSDLRAETTEIVEEELEERPVEEAKIVVAGGWGLNSLGSFELVGELAKVLGGAVGGTRPALDKGWITESRLIGQSGKTVSPDLFISLGASGAAQFTTGFEKAKVILAVEQNPQAPIFETADIGIVGDLRNVLPLLIQELKKGL
jgi:electron transfer flavoprotein alpha subunit